MKVYCFGNEFLAYDSLAKEIVDTISVDGVEFIKADSPDDIVLEEEEIWILDVASGILDVTLIDDLSKLKDNSMCSLHDFDLQFFLKLMKEMGQIKKVNIIAIPMKGDKDKIRNNVVRLLT